MKKKMPKAESKIFKKEQYPHISWIGNNKGIPKYSPI